MADASVAIVANERTFHSVGLQTDVRSVFVGKEEEPGALILIHELEMGYYSRPHGELQTTIYTLDDRDVELLAEALAAAQKRSANLRSAFADVEIPFASPLIDASPLVDDGLNEGAS